MVGIMNKIVSYHIKAWLVGYPRFNNRDFQSCMDTYDRFVWLFNDFTVGFQTENESNSLYYEWMKIDV